MPFDFPTSPVNGQIFSPTGGPVYMFLNGAWLSSTGSAPVVTSSATPTVLENAAFSHTLTANKSVTWIKVGGADQALFTITGSTLSMTAKNYEAPADANGDNIYVVQVMAVDGVGNTAVQIVNVSVTDVSEGGAAFIITDRILDTTGVTSGTTKSYTARALGTASADRIILFALHYSQNHQGRSNPIVTLDGSDMMLASTCERASFQSPTADLRDPLADRHHRHLRHRLRHLRRQRQCAAAHGLRLRGHQLLADPVRLPRRQQWHQRQHRCRDPRSRRQGRGRRPVGLPRRRLRRRRHATIRAVGRGQSGRRPIRQRQPHLDRPLQRRHQRDGARHLLQVPGRRRQGFNGVSAVALAMAPIGTARKFVWDTFDRANSALASSTIPTGLSTAGNWTWDSRTPQININANRLDNANTNGPGTMYSFDLGSADMWAEWMAEIPNASNGPFVFIRGIDYDNFIGVRDANAGVEVYRREASNMNAILSTDFNIMKTTLVRIEAQGTALRVYRNGQLMNSFTLASPFLTPTKAGPDRPLHCDHRLPVEVPGAGLYEWPSSRPRVGSPRLPASSARYRWEMS